MATFPTVPAWSTRNPLGILALFIALIYGMAALLLGISVTQLSATNQTILVAFLVGFPVAVLGTFAWLVARHHRKLYGPGDYRSDDSFLADPSLLGRRLQAEEAIELAPLPPAHPADAPSSDSLPPPAAEAPSGAPEPSDRLPDVLRPSVATAFMAETLAFQELQGELNGTQRRGVRLRHPQTGRYIEVDGFIDNPSGRWIVEVLLIRRMWETPQRLPRLHRLVGLSDHLMVVLVVAGEVLHRSDWSSLVTERAKRDLAELGLGDVDLRVYSFADLTKKYGLQDETLSD